MTKMYTYTMPWGEKLKLRADLSRAEMGIWYLGEDEWVPTPYQTADCEHDESRMLVLVLDMWGCDYYGEGREEAIRAVAEVEAEDISESK